MDKRLRKILKDKNIRLETVPEDFVKLVSLAQGSIFDKIVSFISRLKVTKDGRIASTRANLLILQELGLEVFRTPEYFGALKRFSIEFDTQFTLVNQFYSYSPSEFGLAILDQSKRRALELLMGTSAEANFLNPIKVNLEAAITNGASVSDTIKSIRETALGDNSKLVKYARQIANDNFAIFDRTYSFNAASELNLQWFFYSGGLIKTSRPFCIYCNEKYFHISEIELFGEGLNLDGKPLSKDMLLGRIKGTDAKTIFSFAGGHQCQHTIMGVSISIVPKEVIMRNIKAGRFTPSAAEKKLLSL